MQSYEVVGAEGVQAYEMCDPVAEQRPDRVGGQVPVVGRVRVARVVTRSEQLPEGMDQAGHLELLVGGPSPAQQRGGPQRVFVRIGAGPRSAGRTVPAAVRHPVAAPAGMQQIHQLIDAARFHPPVLPSPPARNAVATHEQIMVGLRSGQRDLNYAPRPAIRWVVGLVRGSSTEPNG